MLICKKGVFNGNVFVSEEGEEYEIVNLWTPNPTNCYVQLENSRTNTSWLCNRKINIVNTKV